MGRPDRQFALTPVGQYGQADRGRTTVVKQLVDRGTRGPPGVEHIIDEQDVTPFDIEGNRRRTALRVQAFFGEIVAVEGHIDQADVLVQAEQFLQTGGDPGATAVNADEGRTQVEVRADQLGELAALRLGVRQGGEIRHANFRTRFGE